MTKDQTEQANYPLSGLGIAAIAVKHFGNPIPQEAYSFAREILDVLSRVASKDAVRGKAQEPEGFKLVPTKPTPEMLEAGSMNIMANTIAGHCYRAMLAAAPQVAQEEGARERATDMELTGWLQEFVRMYQGTLRNYFCDGKPVGRWIVERVMVKSEAPALVATPQPDAQQIIGKGAQES